MMNDEDDLCGIMREWKKQYMVYGLFVVWIIYSLSICHCCCCRTTSTGTWYVGVFPTGVSNTNSTYLLRVLYHDGS